MQVWRSKGRYSLEMNIWKSYPGPVYLLGMARHISAPILSGLSSVQLLSHVRLFAAPMDWSTPDFPVPHQIPELAQTLVHWVSDAIQPSHPLSSPSLPALNLSQHQGLFQEVNSLHQVAKVLEFQLHHQSFQWTFKLLGLIYTQKKL